MNIAIIANRDKDPGLEVSKRVRDEFIRRGANAFICREEKSGGFHFTNPEAVSSADMIVTVGGDGTLIEAARDLIDLNIPFHGINMGMLGFLTETDIQGIGETVRLICEGHYGICERMTARADIYRGARIIASDFALNDAVISKAGHSHIIRFEVSVNGSFLTELHADGMIIATPTGSTAYNLSAGGPIVAPGASMFVMTPICAHSLTARSVVFPDDNVISITVKNKTGTAYEKSSACEAVFDGADNVLLLPGDRVDIRRNDRSIRLVKIRDTGFIEVLRRKMGS